MLEGLCHDFLSKFFCLAVSKNFVGGPFCVSQKSGFEKVYGKEGGGEGASIKIFRRNFLVTSVGNFRRGIL